MARSDARSWEGLFRHALEILDAGAPHAGGGLARWSFGGGTALMLDQRHRVSKDVDIFVTDPQCLGFLSPRLNDVAEAKTANYDEQNGYLKLYFPEGEIDFIVAEPLMADPVVPREILGRTVWVERPHEVLGKKLRYRADAFKARDLFDLACVLERDPSVALKIAPLYAEKREIVAERLRRHESELREDFVALDAWEFTRSYDECLEIVRRHL